jgi:hypothetical protein
MKARLLLVPFLALGMVSAACAQGPQRASLSPSEVQKLRDTQEPGQRIKVYLDLMQTRLSKFDDVREQPVNPEYRTGKYLDEILRQYVELDDELKDWIQYQYNRQGDMRLGLRDLSDSGARQLADLKDTKATPGPYTARYSDTLDDAIADMEDTLDGGTKALAGQVKLMGELKEQAKESARATKQEMKAEKKRLAQERKLAKKEEKLRKKEEKEQNNSD